MTFNQRLDQAVRRGFAKLYPHKGTRLKKLAWAEEFGLIVSEHKAVLMAWDRLVSSRGFAPSPTPKSAGPQPPRFPMSKAEHAGGLTQERA